jgi:hypothetical protein
MNRQILLFTGVIMCSVAAYAQQADDFFSVSEADRIERTLSADDMQGRQSFAPAIDKAASFIAEEFKKSQILPINKKSYFQEFRMVWTKPLSIAVQVNGDTVDAAKIFVLSALQEVSIKKSSKYPHVVLNASDNLDSFISELRKTNKTYFLQVDTAQHAAFSRLKQYSARSFYSDATIIGVLFTGKMETCEVRYSQEAMVHTLKNVAGILPGKSKKEELVIFSAHYDHLGIGKPNAANDSIFNGANDDASGTTAVIMLANYFSRLKSNERTIIFVAFTAEEMGGFGSQHFSRQLDADKVAAMVNIELIGTESKWGNNSAFVTGYEMTDLGKMLQQNLEGTSFTFYPDPYPDQHLFYRSDNATLARLGVPAHTISTSKMDNEKFYHTQDDEIETLDMKNMTAIIRAIAISSRGIVAGRDTPLRVDITAIR